MKPRATKRLALLALVVAVSALSVVATRTTGAEAHAVLLRSEPPAGTTLDASPKTLELWFSEALVPDLTEIRLLDSSGAEFGPLDLSFNPADDKQMSVAALDLDRGSYVVAWSSFSTVDGHRLDGSFSFGVGVAPTGENGATLAPDFTPSAREVAARWVHLIGALALGGAIGTALLFGRRRDGEPHPACIIALVAVISTGMLLIGDFASLLVRADRAGGLGQIGEVISGSDWGEFWLVRLIFAPATLALLLAALSLRWRYRTLTCLAVFGAAVLFWSESSASHAAARTSGLPVFADFVHLSASSAWIGAVLGIPALLLWSRRDPSGARRTAMAGTIRRFAWVAASSFVLILVTGIYRTVQEVPSLAAFLDTTYGKALTAKLALVTVVLMLGAANFLLARRWWQDRGIAQWRALLRTLPSEAAVGAAIVAAVALLTIATPAASLRTEMVRGDDARIGSVVRQRAAAGDLEIELMVEPSDDGRARIAASFVRTQSTRDRPFTQDGLEITQVRFRFRPLDGSVGEARVIAESEGDEVFAVEGPYLPLQGKWTIQVDVRRKNADDVGAKFVYDTEADQRPAWVRVLEDDTIVSSIAQDADNPDILLAGAGDDGIYRSTDGGESWSGPAEPDAYRVVPMRGAAGTFLAAGPNGVFRSVDGGLNWENLFKEEGNTVWDVAVDSRDSNVVVIATRRGIYGSADGGRTWELRLPTPGPPDARPGAADEWSELAVGSDGLFLTGRRPGVLATSRDGGRTWEEFTPSGLDLPGGVMALMIDAEDPSRWFVGSMGSGVWISEDAGAKWRQVTEGVSVNGHGAGFAKGPDGETLVATTGQAVLASTNGTDWTPVGDDRIESSIATDVLITGDSGRPTTVFAAGIGIYRLALSEPLAVSRAEN